jgi:YHS domain-containing protein
MIRNVIRLFIVFIGAVFLRRIVLLALQGLSRMTGAADRSPSARHEQAGGELKQDPVCGTFVATSSSIKTTVDGEVLHFCSTACRDKYKQVA